jgi:hypothetical protein
MLTASAHTPVEIALRAAVIYLPVLIVVTSRFG